MLCRCVGPLLPFPEFHLTNSLSPSESSFGNSQNWVTREERRCVVYRAAYHFTPRSPSRVFDNRKCRRALGDVFVTFYPRVSLRGLAHAGYNYHFPGDSAGSLVVIRDNGYATVAQEPPREWNEEEEGARESRGII